MQFVNDKYADVSIDSYHDELTHLPNRRFFRNILLELNNQNSYLFIIDIDFFKNINNKNMGMMSVTSFSGIR
ncbi:hypothetical protein BB775_12345 [Enterobacter roggenkampii]|nr:hypothetical protein BBX43_18230 [Enterobacter roggenkampii]OHY63623.1 hypothetical protein BB775_12345 [Enterobacter roggenkampii]